MTLTTQGWFVRTAAVCAVLFVLLTAVEDSRLGARIDRPVEALAFAVLDGAPNWLIDGLADLGAPLTTVVLAALVAVALGARGPGRLAIVSFGLFAALVLGQWVLRQWFIDYPSGHVARLVYVLLAAAHLLPARYKAAGIAVAVALGVLMALQRVFTDTHTGTDVVGGALLGGAFGCVFLGLAASEGRRRGRL